ncbi:methyl-accepting chemotaxis protein [Effusibacillus consociatus]|uniref:Methyl-accepting chemotaxis protein n=1 Tax=Effusibacillus consociatus TaxID=1117041 RepID=A0ABV9PXU4_9BACL
MHNQKTRYKFSLTKKIVLGIVTLALVTYLTTAFFLFVLKKWLALEMPEVVFVSGTLLLGVIWSGILGYFAARIITKPLISLVEVATLAASGDLRRQAEVFDSDDEIRQLGLTFNRMLQNLRTMVSNISGNFQQTHSSVNEMTTASETSAHSLEVIADTMQGIAQGAEVQSELTGETAEAVQRTKEIGQQVNTQVSQAGTLCRELVQTLEEGVLVVREQVKGMQTMAFLNQETTEVVNHLEQNAKQIGNIIKVVGDISDQTNLLALNASIEAARAGEQGRGFAVVADEVRQLADQSRQAVEQISGLIRDMQNKVEDVVNRITFQSETAVHEAAKGEATEKALAAMSESVDRVVKSVETIGEFTGVQMQTMQDMMMKAQTVAAIAKETSLGAQQVLSSVQEQTAFLQETAASANMMRQSADNLEKLISSFET